MKYLILILLMFIPITHAVPVGKNKPVVCEDAAIVLAALASDETKEQAVWIGDSDENTSYSLFVNSSSGTWTLLEHVTNKKTCIIGLGTNSRSKLSSRNKLHVQN